MTNSNCGAIESNCKSVTEQTGVFYTDSTGCVHKGSLKIVRDCTNPAAPAVSTYYNLQGVVVPGAVAGNPGQPMFLTNACDLLPAQIAGNVSVAIDATALANAISTLVKNEVICAVLVDGSFVPAYVLTSYVGNVGTSLGLFNAETGVKLNGANISVPCNCPVIDCSPPESPLLAQIKTITAYSGNPASAQIGDVVTYLIRTTNAGDVPLTNVVVTDANAIVVGSPIASLAVGQTVGLQATHVVTAADIAAGKINNQASASGKSPNNAVVTVVSGPNSTIQGPTVQPLTPATPVLVVSNTAPVGPFVAGQVITYAFKVENTGTGTANNVTITDANATVSGGPLASLAAGVSNIATFTATHLVTAAEAASGSIVNNATAAGVNPVTGLAVVSNPSQVTSPTAVAKTQTVKVVTNMPNPANVGSTVTYSITVKNISTVSVSNIVVSDPLATVVGSPITVLLPGASQTLSATHVLTLAEVVAGKVDNQATASGSDAGGNIIVSQSGPVAGVPGVTSSSLVAGVPLLKITKTAGAGPFILGASIPYTFVVQNIGTGPATNVTISDPSAVVVGGPVALLAAGASTTVFTATHVVTAADVTAQQFVNNATANGTNPNTGTAIASPPTTVTVPIAGPKYTVVKNITSVGPYVSGMVISGTYTVTNTGNVPLTNIAVTDNNAVETGSPIAALAVGAVNSVITWSHVMTAAEATAGIHTNTASSTAMSTAGPASATSNTVTVLVTL